MIIDAHTHFGPGVTADRPFGPVVAGSTAQDLIRQLDCAAIDRAVVFAPAWKGGTNERDFIDPNYVQANAAIAEGVRQFPDRLTGIARVNPKYGSEALAELERCFQDYGFAGLYLNNTSEWFTPLHLNLVRPLFESCARHKAIVDLHTWFYPSQAYTWINAIEAFPTVKFVLAHAGHRQWADAVIVAERCPNVFLETSLQLPATVRTLVNRIGAERVLFGTNAPYAFAELELRALRDLEFSATEFERIAGQNAADLLGVALGVAPAVA
jgi:uncharacterized protein